MAKKLSVTDSNGEVFNAELATNGGSGWYINKNGHSTVFVPFSKSIDVCGVSRMATTIEEALRIGQTMMARNEDAEDEFEKAHPELNP